MSFGFGQRRGSALLIVLGMLSFMVVSAVGFSIYMRQGRAPSSYLRRNVASRYLVKAALANAIGELEGGFMSQYDIGLTDSNNPETGYFFGVYDDPFPGVGPQGGESLSEINGGDSFTRNGNFWFKRVFCPFGPLRYPESADDAREDPSETAPTLTLEALAYLPPAIIDDVRKVSRLTRTAQWRSLPYETGRYAYTAVNVSDLFDINRLRASARRNSGNDRISLSVLTSSQPDDPSNVDAGRAEALDAILDKPLDNAVAGGIVPFTSLADFNLAAGDSAFAPFMKYVGSGSAILMPDDPEAANALFAVDSWFPTTNVFSQASGCYNLGGVDGLHQPFKKNGFVARAFIDVSEDTCENPQDQVGRLFDRNLGIGMACLYDYLDSDSVPISLALPTTEAVPMVVSVSGPFASGGTTCGLNVDVGNIGGEETGNYTVNGFYLNEDGNSVPAQVKIVRKLQQIGVTSFGRAKVQCLAALPFKRLKTTGRFNAADYKYRGVMKVWLAPPDMGCRPGVTDGLYPQRSDVESQGNNGVALNGVATFVSSSFANGKPFGGWGADVKKPEEALEEFDLDFDNMDIEMPVFWQVTETIDPNQEHASQLQVSETAYFSAEPYLSLGNMKNNARSLRPLDLNGSVFGKWNDEADKAINKDAKDGIPKLADDAFSAQQFRLYAAVWVQVLNKDGQVVDMVPACVQDDVEWLRAPQQLVTGATEQMCGSGAPLLNFMSADAIDFNKTMLDSDALKKPKFVDWTELYAVDPRFNFAPENWYAKENAGQPQPKSTWAADIGIAGGTSGLLGQNGRDRDIFMFVSDQEYLQSIGELAFLPRLERFRENNSEDLFLNGFDYAPIFNGARFAERKVSPTEGEMGKFAQGGLFWRTYSAYQTYANDDDDNYGTKYANPYRLRDTKGKLVKFVSDVGTFKVNPYSDDNRVLAAALVSTPFDYYVASTNENQQQSNGRKNELLKTLTLENMKTTYAWGDSPVAKMSGEKILDVMDVIRAEFGKAGSQSWTSVWDDELVWQRDEQNFINEMNNEFLGVTLEGGDGSRLDGVDRKFLYSYWRDCFDNAQQLYLIFVRAEPASVGGGASGGVSSAQLGGRAVALVWRDPSVPAGLAGGTRPQRQNITSRDSFRDLKKNFPPHRTRVLFYHQFD